MKGRDFNQKPNFEPGVPNRKLDHLQVENFGYLTRPTYGVGLQMTLFSFTTRASRVRAASKIFIPHYHMQFHGGSHPQGNKEVKLVQKHEAWFVKVVCTLFVCSQPLDNGFLGYLSKNLTPLVEFEVVKRLNNPTYGLKFFEFSRVNFNITHSFWTYNLLIRSFCHMGLLDSAKLVFDYMRIDEHLADSTMVGFMVSAFGRAGKFGMAKKLLAEIQSDEVGVGIFALNNLLNMMVKQNMLEEAVSLYKENLGSNFYPDNWTFNILIRGLCRVGKVDQAFEFFNDMRSFGCFPDIVTYNTIINGLCRANEVDRGHKFLNEIQSRDDCSPDVVTYTSVISGYCKLGKMGEASALFNEMISSGIVPSVVTFNVLIDGFGKVGDMLSAKSLYEKMVSFGCIADVITFTSLIDGYCRIGDVNQSLQLWNAMKVRNVSPNVYTFAITINALCKENRLHEACEFLRELQCRNIVPKPFIFNPVIDGFCKAGNLDEANRIVMQMEEKKCYPDKVTYTILIIGHCMKGRMLEAISIFDKMLSVGCTPDNVTIHSLISCLLKAGMPNEVYRITTIASQDMRLAGSSSLDNNAPLRINRDVPVAA
ncbi:pentatricopeptide repeat-containing protein At2g06000-like [Durio zibethinus]|uniref:Pentatricopeptide repeat-containing protein At2g06000-like n=1 Tax=Durio zibethinus TaxID=66656 RepID=A0A6P5XT42_DURZI|nr:pentatricopeptide repeat-containing protein At2g06000-like [Durio zibethinus]XP_022731026.1 pentatricopeptide repeat-containing protein At2g06000-like [Durio zibethinus]